METQEGTLFNISKMSTASQPTAHLERIPAKYGCTGILMTIVLFQLVAKVVDYVGAPKSVQKDFWKWKNIFISWIHAVIVGVWDIACFILYPEMWQDLINHYSVCAYAMVVFSSGYFIYDFIDIIMNEKLKKCWEVLVHHVAVASMFFYNVVHCQCISYNVIALLAEGNSIFLHTRKLLQMSRVDFNSPLYRINSVINLVTFIFCRFGCLIGIGYGMYFWRHRVSPFYYWTLSTATYLMVITNVILFWRLLRSDIIRKAHSRSKDSIPEENGQLIGANNNIKDKLN